MPSIAVGITGTFSADTLSTSRVLFKGYPEILGEQGAGGKSGSREQEAGRRADAGTRGKGRSKGTRRKKSFLPFLRARGISLAF
jgi:hypothetical protein